MTTRFGDIDEKIETMEASLSAVPDLQELTSTLQSESSTSALAAIGASIQGDADTHVEITKDITLTQSFAVFGESILGKTTIAGSLLVDGSVLVSEDSIQTGGSTLYLQRDRLANLDIMGGVVVVNTLGNVIINGNMNITGDLAVNGVLGAHHIRADGETLTIDLPQIDPSSTTSGFARLLIRGKDNTTVASIDAEGNISRLPYDTTWAKMPG